MERSGHTGLALLFITPITAATALLSSAGWALLTTVIALSLVDIPDIDQNLPAIPHRGPTHTVWAAIAVSLFGAGVALSVLFHLLATPPAFLTDSLLLAAISPYLAALLIFISLLIVYLSHIIGDILTTGSAYYGMDIKPFAPVTEFSPQLRLFKSDSIAWNFSFFAAGAGVHLLVLFILVL